VANGILHNPGRGQKLRPDRGQKRACVVERERVSDGCRANRLGREFKCIRWNLKRLADLNAA
jgi:hypothetical protein